MTVKKFETDFAGKKLIIETGRYLTQADAAVTAQIGDTVVLATASMGQARDDIDFFPLMVDLEERYCAGGAIKGPKFSKREGKPSLDSILNARYVDRGIRPLFPQDMRNEVQVIILPLSLDYQNGVDIVGMLAATCAVHLSKIPFDGPVAGVKVGWINGDFVINPTTDELAFSELDLTVMGDGERITMVDCGAKEIPDEKMEEAFKVAMDAMGPIAKFFDKIRDEVGQPKASDDEVTYQVGSEEDKKIIDALKKLALPHLEELLFNRPHTTKAERRQAMNTVEDLIIKEYAPKLVSDKMTEEDAKKYLKSLTSNFFYKFVEEQVSLAILTKDKRIDGRRLDEIRPLSAEVSVLPRPHGTGLFTRGETQVLSTVTLGAPGDALYIESMERDSQVKYFHHYNMLPFSVGDVSPLRGAGRRELGHGALAEKALRPVLPDEEEFPYTIRVVSEVMGSNGSSSMASTCGSTLALMDAGVPIKKPVAGIAMGLVSDGKRWKVITDLQDLEDGPGGMDFKFTSTKDGITAVQMDTKTRGLSMDIIKATIKQMRPAINEILDLITSTIPEPRKELSPYAPRIISIMINPEKISDVIGPGGKMVRSITDELGVQIDIFDSGEVIITSPDAIKAEEAERRIKNIVREVHVGDVFEDAEVVNVMPFGAFVNLIPGTDGLVHVSEMAWEHVDKPTDKVKLGDKVKVKVLSIKNGKVDVSMKALLPKPEGYVEPPKRDRMGGRERSSGRGRSGRRRDDRHSSGRDRWNRYHKSDKKHNEKAENKDE